MKSITEAYKRMNQPVKEVEVITETTVPKELHSQVMAWDHHSKVDAATKEKMRNAFGGNTFIHFPLSDSSLPDPDVHEHLVNNGYKIDDYHAGLASKTVQVGNPDRGIPLRTKKITKRIGAIINDTNAPDHVKKAYDNDPARTSAKSDDLHVMISTTPLAIAGMTTGTNWHLESCMELEEGSARHSLVHDSEHGTHVAYLVHKNDKGAFEHGEPDAPVGRVLLKAFKSQKSDDTIYRPESRVYGGGNSAFSNHVAEWAHEKYPAKAGETYEKHPELYDDDNENLHTEVNQRGLDNIVSGHGSHSPVILPRHKIDYVMNKVRAGDTDSVDGIKYIRNLNPHDVKELTNKFGLDSLADHHGSKYTEHMINSFVAQLPKSNLPVSSRLPRNMLMASKLPSNVVDILHPNLYQYVRRSKLKPQHLENAIARSSILGVEATKHLAQEHHLVNMVTTGMMTGYEVGMHPNFTKAVHDELIGTRHNDMIQSSKHASISDISSPPDVIRLAKNKNIDHSRSDLKDVFMAHIKNAPDNSLLTGIFGHATGNMVPKSISQHLTDDDYKTLADKRIETAFSDHDAHKKFAQVSLDNAHISPLHAGHAANTLQWFADEHHSSNSVGTKEFLKSGVERLMPHKDVLRHAESATLAELNRRFGK